MSEALVTLQWQGFSCGNLHRESQIPSMQLDQNAKIQSQGATLSPGCVAFLCWFFYLFVLVNCRDIDLYVEDMLLGTSMYFFSSLIFD